MIGRIEDAARRRGAQIGGWVVVILSLLALPGAAQEKTATLSTRVLQKEAVVDAPQDTLWWAWTTPEGLESFFPEEAEVALRPGGAYELVMDGSAPEGERGSEGCRILAYVPFEMLAFTWNAPPKIPALRKSGAKTIVVVRFEPAGAGRTRVFISQLGFGEGDDWEAYYRYFDRAWGLVMGWEQEKLAGKSAPDEQGAAGGAPRVAEWEDGAVRVRAVRGPSMRQDFEVLLPSPVATVWEALATMEGMRRLIGADAGAIDLKLFGPYETGDGRERRVLAYLPMRVLAVTADGADESGPFAVYSFRSDGPDRCRLRLSVLGWEKEDEKTAAAFDRLLEQNRAFLNQAARKLGEYEAAHPRTGVLRWEALLDAPPAEVWKAFVTKEGAQSWMAPRVEIDFRINGTVRANYDPDAGVGGPGTIVHHILSYEPEHVLSMRFDAPDNAFKAKIAEAAWEVYRFEDAGDGKTRFTLSMCGWGDGPEWEACGRFFDGGNRWELEQLRKVFATKAGGG